MYERFFGLRERPFDLVPNPRYLFLTGRQREALGNLRLGLTTPRSLTLLLGEAGTGKTTLVETVVGEMIRQQNQVVLVSNPLLRREEFFEILARGFGLSDEAARSKSRFLIELREHLAARTDAGLLTAVVFDEAQSLPYKLLEEIRLLSNIETSTTKMLNVVLAGQPELALRLNDGGLRQLKQRISLRCELTRFDSLETAAYVAGRLRIAGGEPAAIFSREAILAIHAASRGLPRTINVICDNAMIGGFALQTKPILRALIEEVCSDFDLTLPPPVAPLEPPAAAAPPPPVAAAGGARVVFKPGTPAPSRLIAPDPD
jgi:type II secretory pathway predicted ATPase ExeA